MKKMCFVIQPFNEKFNKRFEDIIKPAIEKCGLQSYRVDKDDSVVIPINSIEQMIKKSSLCVAEISTNNPNVWYEVGYAMALNIPIILICSDERTEQYPFDIRHLNILQYKTLSYGDYKKLKENLMKRINAYMQLKENEEEFCGLTPDEKSILLMIAKHQEMPNQVISQKDIQYNDIDKTHFIFLLRRLINKGFIQFIYTIENGVSNNYCQLTNKGEDWILKNT